MLVVLVMGKAERSYPAGSITQGDDPGRRQTVQDGGDKLAVRAAMKGPRAFPYQNMT